MAHVTCHHGDTACTYVRHVRRREEGGGGVIRLDNFLVPASAIHWEFGLLFPCGVKRAAIVRRYTAFLVVAVVVAFFSPVCSVFVFPYHRLSVRPSLLRQMDMSDDRHGGLVVKASAS